MELYKNFGYTKFNTYNLNGCVYMFDNIYTKENEYYKMNEKGNYSRITPTNLFGNYFIKLRDINGNLICVKIENQTKNKS